MRTFRLLGLLAFAPLCDGFGFQLTPEILIGSGTRGDTVTFGATGSLQTYVVGSDVDMIEVKVFGAAGGGSTAEGFSFPGGCGGYSSGYISVTPGQSFGIEVGQGGEQTCSAKARPYPHGGLPSYRGGYCAGQGGGRSSVIDDAATYLVVAGGGGGSAGKGCNTNSCSTAGGGGGGLTGARGLASCTCDQTGGVGGAADGSVGIKWQGQDACQDGSCNSVGGGGDGYYGGMVAGPHGGGGGGSGYIHESVLQGSTVTALTCQADMHMAAVTGGTGASGKVEITPISKGR